VKRRPPGCSDPRVHPTASLTVPECSGPPVHSTVRSSSVVLLLGGGGAPCRTSSPSARRRTTSSGRQPSLCRASRGRARLHEPAPASGGARAALAHGHAHMDEQVRRLRRGHCRRCLRIMANFVTVVVGQLYWQSAIAAEPVNRHRSCLSATSYGSRSPASLPRPCAWPAWRRSCPPLPAKPALVSCPRAGCGPLRQCELRHDRHRPTHARHRPASAEGIAVSSQVA